MYLTHMETNLKSPNGDVYSTPLGRLTLLLGKNEANKSAVAEAAMLAKTGSVLGLPYKDKAMKGAEYLATLIPISGSSLIVSAKDANGHAYRFDYERGSRAKREGPEAKALVMHTLREKMGASDETRALFLYEYLQPPMAETTLAGFPPEAQSLLGEICPGGGDLLALIKAIDKQLKLTKGSIVAATSMLAAPGSVSAVSDDQLASAWAGLRAAFVKEVAQEMAQEGAQADILRILLRRGGGNAAVRDASSWDEASKVVRQVATDRRLHATLQVAQATKTRATIRKERLSQLRGVLVEQVFEALRVPVAALSVRASRFLPEGEAVVFHVIETTIRPFLSKPTGEYRAISGSTEQRFLIALACAMSQEGDLLVMADRAFDPQTLAVTMRALAKAPCQVLITSPIKPKGRKPSGWSYVELAREDGAPLDVAVL
tara:strand:+ start:4782 stop:6074 length:1293 start_codon:yes stop_codon:yes gene_type:complete